MHLVHFEITGNHIQKCIVYCVYAEVPIARARARTWDRCWPPGPDFPSTRGPPENRVENRVEKTRDFSAPWRAPPLPPAPDPGITL